MRKVLASIKEPVILLESCSRQDAELCVSGLFNMMGGIKARYISVSNTDTDFRYNVVSDTIRTTQIKTAQAFCSGIKYGRR